MCLDIVANSLCRSIDFDKLASQVVSASRPLLVGHSTLSNLGYEQREVWQIVLRLLISQVHPWCNRATRRNWQWRRRQWQRQSIGGDESSWQFVARRTIVGDAIEIAVQIEPVQHEATGDSERDWRTDQSHVPVAPRDCHQNPAAIDRAPEIVGRAGRQHQSHEQAAVEHRRPDKPANIRGDLQPNRRTTRYAPLGQATVRGSIAQQAGRVAELDGGAA
jgi:hypothetical protein